MQLNDFLHNHFIQIAIVLLAVSPVQVIGRRFIERLIRNIVKADRYETKLDEKKREDTIINMFHALFMVVVWIAAILIGLTIFEVNIGSLLAGAGVFGVIIGLGAQSTIKDYIAGIYILAENQYRVGDIVTLSGGTTGQLGASGVVEEITLRITRLRDLNGTLTTIRNGEASIITNRTFKYANVLIELGLDFDTDMKKAEKVINDTGKDMLRDQDINKLVVEPMSYLRISDLANGYVVQAIGKVKPAAQWDVASDFRRRIIPALAKHGIVLSVKQVNVKSLDEPAQSKKPAR